VALHLRIGVEVADAVVKLRRALEVCEQQVRSRTPIPSVASITGGTEIPCGQSATIADTRSLRNAQLSTVLSHCLFASLTLPDTARPC